MPATQTALRAVYDFGAPSVEAIVLGFRVRANMGGKLELLFENPVSARPATPGFFETPLPFTYSIQVAPALATGLPDTFIATTAANNLEAVTDVVCNPGENNSHTLLIRPNIDSFVLVVASGGARGQMQVVGDNILDLWRTVDGVVELTPI